MPREAGKRTVVTSRCAQKARLVFNPSLSLITDYPSPLRELADSLFSVIFPTRCSICSGEVASAGGLGVCHNCWSEVESWQGTCCERCGLPIISERASDSAQILCGACRADDRSFDLARVFGIYRGNLRFLILQLKFRRRERLGRRLGAFLMHPWEDLEGFIEDESPLIVPVPLFQLRERERGFNQAHRLAEGLRHCISRMPDGRELRIEDGLLRRTRPTLPQAGLRYKARKENVQGAFDVARPQCLRGRQVVLVDDVMTTGATLSACAKALKKGGAARVFALALARATPQFPDIGELPQVTGVDEFAHDW